MLKNVKFIFGKGDNLIQIGDDCSFDGVEFVERYGGKNRIVVGNHTTSGSGQWEASENTTLSIGEDCMFSYHIFVWTCAHHSIVNGNGERQNKSKSISIGNHCWIGHSAMILKGAQLSHNCILGAKSLLTKPYSEPNSIYAGHPAKKIKENISWKRELIDFRDENSQEP